MRPYYLDVLERRVPGRDLLREVWHRLRRRLFPAARDDRQIWTPADVIDVDGPELNIRSYLEHQDIRSMVAVLPADRRRAAMEVGCGYGRLIMVFREFFPRVIGVEREPALLETARTLVSGIEYVNPAQLWDLTAVQGPIDFAMVFTVLMHMTDSDARRVIEAIKEKVGKGWILLVEHTAGDVVGDTTDNAAFMMHGRSIEQFEQWLKPFKLIKTQVRRVESTSRYKDNGSYMLFANP